MLFNIYRALSFYVVLRLATGTLTKIPHKSFYYPFYHFHPFMLYLVNSNLIGVQAKDTRTDIWMNYAFWCFSKGLMAQLKPSLSCSLTTLINNGISLNMKDDKNNNVITCFWIHLLKAPHSLFTHISLKYSPSHYYCTGQLWMRVVCSSKANQYYK